jgi:tetratricopeptide (TPR) repeat protein
MSLLAKVQYAVGDLDGSLRILEVANKICPSNPERLTLIGDVYVKKGNLPAAKKAYLEALDVYPPFPAAREGLVQIPMTAAEVEAAVQTMRGVMSEKDRAALLNKAAIQAVNARHYPDAVRIYGFALQHLQEDELKAAIRAQDRDKIKKIIAARDRHQRLNEVREAPQCFCLEASDDRGETLLVSASTFGCRCNGWFHHQCIWNHFKRCSNSELGQLLHAWRWQDHVVACPYCRTLLRVSRPPPRQRYRKA